MLKDLDQRSSEQSSMQSDAVPITVQRSPKKNMLTIIAIVFCFNVVALLMWQLYSENQQLKQSKANDSAALSAIVVQTPVEQVSQSKPAKPASPNAQEKISENTAVATQIIAPNNKEEKLAALASKPIKQQTLQQGDLPKPKQVNASNAGFITEKTVDKKAIAQPVAPKTLEKPMQVKAEAQSRFSITRRQLSSSELAQQKVQQAEKALTANNVEKAEQLFEDTLLLQPEHKHARKKLAALWFARKAYQPALNVLSQGIALEPNDGEFRLMKARIYLSVGNNPAALSTLQGLPDSPDKEYQLLRANVAQQGSQFDVAISAYKNLLIIEPQGSRWWLGLAIAYDSNSQFSLASKAYQQALNYGELSNASASFAQQRLQDLGE